MKINLKHKKSTSNPLRQVQATKTAAMHTIKEVAQTFHAALLSELSASALPEEMIREIAGTITIAAKAPDSLAVYILSPHAVDVEYGSRQMAETPWIRRAIQKTRQQMAAKAMKRGAG